MGKTRLFCPLSVDKWIKTCGHDEITIARFFFDSRVRGGWLAYRAKWYVFAGWIHYWWSVLFHLSGDVEAESEP